jgi:glycosyltransferase involved in cell wall biosynthesis
VKPLVSILIPAYNSERWISEAIESALVQTWPAKEILVVDDGSTDQTLSIARKFASASVSVITQPNEGAASARNKAYSLSQGDYIQWLDADDLLAADKISRQIELLLHEGTRRTLVSSAFGRFRHRVSRAQFSPTSLWCDLSPIDWLVRKLEDNVFMQTATWLASRELAEAAGPWDTRLLGDDDGEYFCRVILASDIIRFVPDAKVFYRRTGGGSLSQLGQSPRKIEAHFLSMASHIRYLRSLEDSARVRSACLVFLQRWLVYFYPERPDLVKQLEELATQLGGQLEPPRMSWKYAWIQELFGLPSAKRTQLVYNEWKASLLNWLDATLFRLRI